MNIIIITNLNKNLNIMVQLIYQLKTYIQHMKNEILLFQNMV